MNEWRMHTRWLITQQESKTRHARDVFTRIEPRSRASVRYGHCRTLLSCSPFSQYGVERSSPFRAQFFVFEPFGMQLPLPPALAYCACRSVCCCFDPLSLLVACGCCGRCRCCCCVVVVIVVAVALVLLLLMFLLLLLLLLPMRSYWWGCPTTQALTSCGAAYDITPTLTYLHRTLAQVFAE